MRKIILALIITLCLSSVGALAADLDFNFDDLFGDDLFFESEEVESDINPEDVLLVNEGWELGGNYNLSARATSAKVDSEKLPKQFETRLGGNLFLDARPNADFRLFAKVGLDYAVAREEGETGNRLKLNLEEIFSDFHYDNKVFFRAGKQNVAWGVGYFFSPADVINIGRKDPLEPEADREGPVALKVHYPHGRNNYYLYTLFDGVTHPKDIGIAAKAEYVLGRSEVGVGAYYQNSKAPRLSLTLSTSAGQLALFGEAVVSKGSDKGFVGRPDFSDYPVKDKDTLFFHATAGGLYTYSDPNNYFNFTTGLQYYYNGEGYKDQDAVKNSRMLYSALNSDDKTKPLVAHVLPSDLFNTGKHYAAGMLSWNNMLDSKFTPSVTVLSNLSDKSGVVNASLSLPSFSSIRPSIGANFTYGEFGSEYGIGFKNSQIYAAITLGSGSF